MMRANLPPQGGPHPLLQPLTGLKIGQRYAVSIAWFVAFVQFFAVFGSLSFMYHKKIDAICICAGALFVSALYGMPSAEARLRSSSWRWMPLLTSGGSVVLAAWLGESNYSWYMRHYYDIKYGHIYTNVLADNPASNYADASIFRFSHDVHVDSSKTVGFLKDKDVYCAAPIISSTAPLSHAATFWAVGRNCCTPMKNEFLCASGTLEKSMSTAEFTATKTATLATFDSVREASDRANFLSAVKMANSRFAFPPMAASDAVLLLNWSKNPEEDLDAFHQGGVLFFWILSLLVGFIYAALALLWKPDRKSPAHPNWVFDQIGIVRPAALTPPVY